MSELSNPSFYLERAETDIARYSTAQDAAKQVNAVLSMVLNFVVVPAYKNGPSAFTSSVHNNVEKNIARGLAYLNAFISAYGSSKVPAYTDKLMTDILDKWTAMSEWVEDIEESDLKEEIKHQRYLAIASGDLDSPYLTPQERQYYKQAAARGELQQSFGISSEVERKIAAYTQKGIKPAHIGLGAAIAGVAAFVLLNR